MGFTSIWHWLIVLVIVLLIFGAGKLPKVAGDLAKGIKNFKSGLKDEDTAAAPTVDPAVPPPAGTVHTAAQPAARPNGQPAHGAAPETTAPRPSEPVRS